MEAVSANTIDPKRVKNLLSEHLLTKGMMPMVLDMEASQGVRLHDKKSGRRSSTCLASMPQIPSA